MYGYSFVSMGKSSIFWWMIEFSKNHISQSPFARVDMCGTQGSVMAFSRESDTKQPMDDTALNWTLVTVHFVGSAIPRLRSD